MVSAPGVLIAMNEPSRRKFAVTVRPGGWILYNGDCLPHDCTRGNIQALALPFTNLADQLGDARIANMVMLGALLEIAREIPKQNVEAALQHLVNSARWLDLDRRAIQKGRELFRDNCARKATTAVAACED